MEKKLFKSILDNIIRDISTFGGLPAYCGLMLFIFLLENLATFAYQLLFGIIIIMVVAVLFRTFYYKARPKELPNDTFLQRLEASSFPSIHAARAWFLAFIFTTIFSSKLIWFLLFTAAFSISYSRYYMKRHDFCDLLAGFVLGLITFAIVNKII